MLDVQVTSANGQHHSRVQLPSEFRLTPKTARAALEIAGYWTGTVSLQATDMSGENTYYKAYRVYPRSVKKIVDDVR
jgi:hypothetical protein